MQLLLFSASLLGFLGVAAGAFGAHALKTRLTPEMLNAFEIGVRYQMYHIFAIFAAVWLSSPISGTLFLIGTLLFSGSLYLLAFTSIRFFGAITPIGGLILLAGWITLALKIFQSQKQ